MGGRCFSPDAAVGVLPTKRKRCARDIAIGKEENREEERTDRVSE